MAKRLDNVDVLRLAPPPAFEGNSFAVIHLADPVLRHQIDEIFCYRMHPRRRGVIYHGYPPDGWQDDPDWIWPATVKVCAERTIIKETGPRTETVEARSVMYPTDQVVWVMAILDQKYDDAVEQQLADSLYHWAVATREVGVQRVYKCEVADLALERIIQGISLAVEG